MQFPVMIGLHRSFLLIAWVLLLHGLAALVAVLQLPQTILPAGAAWAALGLILLSLLRSWRILRPRVTALRLKSDGGIECRLVGSDEWREGRVLPGATVHPLLVVLPLEVGGARACRLVLTRGSARPEELRRLRVWLRWRPQGLSSSAGAA